MTISYPPPPPLPKGFSPQNPYLQGPPPQSRVWAQSSPPQQIPGNGYISAPWRPYLTKVYLAGKISMHDWRPNSGTDRGTNRDYRDWGSVQWNGLDIVGPFFTSCDHGCAHGKRTHAVGDCGLQDWVEARQYAFSQCRRAIGIADIYFCWLAPDVGDYCTAYGTLVEVGMAHALGKRIIIAAPELPGRSEPDFFSSDLSVYTSTDDLWFAFSCAQRIIIKPTAEESLEQLAREEGVHPRLESQTELLFWRALMRINPPEIQDFEINHPVDLHEDGVAKIDFALPDIKVGIEVDGFEFHSKPEHLDSDHHRQTSLQLAGWQIIRFSYNQIARDPDASVARAAKFVDKVRNAR